MSLYEEEFPLIQCQQVADGDYNLILSIWYEIKWKFQWLFDSGKGLVTDREGKYIKIGNFKGQTLFWQLKNQPRW